jgi:hypothetical protein
MDTQPVEPADPIDEIAILLRNTNYSREICVEKLNELGSVEAVIKDYLGVRVEKYSTVTVNQGIYTSIRKFLDRESKI